MYFDPTLDHREIPDLILQAIQIGTPKAWRARIEKCAKQASDNPLLGDYLAKRYAIEFAMAEVCRYKRSTGRVPAVMSATAAMHQLYAFSATLCKVHDRLSAAGQIKLSGRLRGGLTDDVGISGLVFEMQTAVHLLLQGVDITWHDLEGSGGFDLLCRKGGLEVEIECKSFSGDVGRKIHLRRQYQLGGGSMIKQLIAALERQGPTYLDVQIPGRLVGAEIHKVADRLQHSLETGQEFAGPEPCTISISPLPMDRIPFGWSDSEPSIDVDAVSDAIFEIFGHRRRNFLVTLSRQAGAIVAGIASRQDDAVVDGIFHELKNACRQLSGARPGVVCAHLLDITPAQLQEIHDAPKQNNMPTALHEMVARFFQNPNRSHVHTLRFSVPGFIERGKTQEGNILQRHARENGPSFVFTSNTHPLRTDPRMAAFR